MLVLPDKPGNAVTPITAGYTTYTCDCGATYTDSGVGVNPPIDPDPPVAFSLRNSNVSVTTEVLDFTYDTSGGPFSLTYNGTTYYYVVNLQGDVIRLVSGTGATVAEYEYDPYGRVISGTGTVVEVNPLRYRGYYYDAETEFYYLQSRYYDPTICRFINADVLLNSGGGAIGYNQFQYCGCNPINNYDTTGYAADLVTVQHYSDISFGYGGGAAISTGFSIGIRVGYKARASILVGTTVGLGAGGALASFLDDIFAPSSAVTTKSLSVADRVHAIARCKAENKYTHKIERHHIVAQNDPRAMPARAILDGVGIKINSNENIVPLSTAMHKRLHTNQYYALVNTIVMHAYLGAGENPYAQKAAVKSVLRYVKASLEAMDGVMTPPWFGT